tara:strand:- start:329 stop:556 length:228 start_codon:yes stop_codon:yes gene_type:complete
MPKKKCEYHGDDDESNNVYMFHHQKLDINLFTNADTFEQAMMKFDLCEFPDRDNWKIFLECAHQPTGGKHERKAR